MRFKTFLNLLIEGPEDRIARIKALPENQKFDLWPDYMMRENAIRPRLMDVRGKAHSELRKIAIPDNPHHFESALPETHALAAGFVIDHIAEHDPSPNKEYTQWMVNKYRSKLVGSPPVETGKQFRGEDLPRIRDSLTEFHGHKRELKLLGRPTDINAYKTIADLHQAVKEWTHDGSSFSDEYKEKLRADPTKVKIHLDTPRVRVEEALDPKTSIALHSDDTEWCTAEPGNGMWKRYREDGPLFQIHFKNEPRIGARHKIQLHFGSSQIKDARDQDVYDLDEIVKTYPELKNIPAVHKDAMRCLDPRNDDITADAIHFVPDEHKNAIVKDWAEASLHNYDHNIAHHIVTYGDADAQKKMVDNLSYNSTDRLVGDMVENPRTKIETLQYIAKNSRTMGILGPYGPMVGLHARLHAAGKPLPPGHGFFVTADEKFPEPGTREHKLALEKVISINSSALTNYRARLKPHIEKWHEHSLEAALDEKRKYFGPDQWEPENG